MAGPSKFIDENADHWRFVDPDDASESKDASGHDHGADGRFGTGSGGGSKPDAPKSGSGEPHAQLHADAEPKAQGIVGKLKAVLGKITDAPVLKQAKGALGWLKGKQQQFAAALEKRYGKKTARAIMASGFVTDAAVTGIGAVMGKVLYIPGLSILGALPAAALAEGYLQAKKLLGKSGESVEPEDVELSADEMQAAAEEHARDLANEFVEYLLANGLTKPKE